MLVESNLHDFSGVKIENPEPGLWDKYTLPKMEMYLHERLGFTVATTLALWEDVGTTKVTKNEHGRIIGVIIRSN